MCFVKDLFWHEEECVMQLHPPRSEYVNNNRYCLHLWRPTCQEIPTPPSGLVGIVGIGPAEAARLAAQIRVDDTGPWDVSSGRGAIKG
ncbi:DUF7694 domain-containing protein [Bradyrhizobium sp. DASA03120]|uniref:DUF7694 domain-containing protein n=1 Tax=Bradyrhizobium sp. SMVTL-02 TaxID=3395917 RepID=UPI003F726877